MLGVGFEPTSANTVDLKSTPLDRSGILAGKSLKIQKFKNSKRTPPLGFEPRTSRLTAARSNQLSYRGSNKKTGWYGLSRRLKL